MRATILRLREGTLEPESVPDDGWHTVSEWDGSEVTGVENAEIHRSVNGTVLLVRIRAGGVFPLHAGRVYSVCQIISGRGVLGLPNRRELPYRAPELFLFEPGTLHSWGASEDTLFSVCEIAPGT